VTTATYRHLREIRRRSINRDITLASARPFYIPLCAQCRTALRDAAGEPRWDLLEGRFVCLGRCPS
jgi:hypothetical protein